MILHSGRLRLLELFAVGTLLGLSAALHTSSDASKLSGRSDPLIHESQALSSTLNAFTTGQMHFPAPRLTLRRKRRTREPSPLYRAGISAVLALRFLAIQRFRLPRITKRKSEKVRYGSVPQRTAQRQNRSVARTLLRRKLHKFCNVQAQAGNAHALESLQQKDGSCKRQRGDLCQAY